MFVWVLFFSEWVVLLMVLCVIMWYVVSLLLVIIIRFGNGVVMVCSCEIFEVGLVYVCAFLIFIDIVGFEKLVCFEEVDVCVWEICCDFGNFIKVFLGIDCFDYIKGIYVWLCVFSELIVDGSFLVEDVVFV